MKKTILSMLLAVMTVGAFTSCKSDQEKAEDVIREYMRQTAYDYNSYDPIETKIVSTDSIKTIYKNKRSINAAVEICKELNKKYEDGRIYTFFDCLVPIEENKSEFTTSNLSQSNNYIGFAVSQKFRIKNKKGESCLTTYRFFTDSDFSKVLYSYEIKGDFEGHFSVGKVLEDANKYCND